MKLLIISRTPWSRSNSFGNTYSNFFATMPDLKIANIYLADGLPEKESFHESFFQISEKEMASSIFKRKRKVGKKLLESDLKADNIFQEDNQKKQGLFGKVFGITKKSQWSGFFLARELVWKWGKLNKEALLNYIEEFKPDAVFMAVYYAKYVSDVARLIKKHFDIPLIVESAVDVYTMNQISFDPFFWINRLIVRKSVKKMYHLADKRYLISEKQCRDYSEIFGLDFKVLYKTPDKTRELYPYEGPNGEIQLLYTGNLGSGRWKVLAKVAEALKSCPNAKLDIYSASPMSSRMRNKLEIDNISKLHPPVNSSEILKLQNEADILLHVESFDKKNMLEVRYAISTKVMDYISDCRCIVAIGPENVASLEFLENENAAISVNDINNIENELKRLVLLPENIKNQAKLVKKACDRLLNKPSATEMLYKDICELLRSYKTRSI